MPHYASETYFNNGEVEVRLERDGVTFVLLTGEPARIIEDHIDRAVMFDDYDALQKVIRNYAQIVREELSSSSSK